MTWVFVVLCSFCMNFVLGEKLGIELAVPKIWRKRRPVSVSAVPFRPGTERWRSCRFLGNMVRALTDMPGLQCWCQLLSSATSWMGTVRGVVLPLDPGRRG